MVSDLIWDSYYGEGDLPKITDFEKCINCNLPEEYKKTVKKYNGAFIANKNVFRFYSNLVEQEVEYGTGMFLPYGDIDGVTETMELKRQYPPEGFVDGLIIFSALGNGDFLCFDYRKVIKTANPSIVIWHHEGTSGGADEISLIAQSYNEFLKILYEEDDDDDDDD